MARRAEICPGQIYRWRRELSVTLRVRPPPVSGLIRAGCGSVEATPVKEMVRWRGFSLSGALIAPAFAPCAIVAQVARPAEVCPLASSMMMAADRAQKTVSGQPFGLTHTLPLFIAFLSASVATSGPVDQRSRPRDAAGRTACAAPTATVPRKAKEWGRTRRNFRVERPGSVW